MNKAGGNQKKIPKRCRCIRKRKNKQQAAENEISIKKENFHCSCSCSCSSSFRYSIRIRIWVRERRAATTGRGCTIEIRRIRRPPVTPVLSSVQMLLPAYAAAAHAYDPKIPKWSTYTGTVCVIDSNLDGKRVLKKIIL